MAKNKQDDSVDFNESSKNVLDSLLEKDKTHHYNYEEDRHTFVSMGSLNLDSAISLNEGVHRFCGIAGGGKTSEACEVVRNFLIAEPKRKALWIKAEGRLSENVQKRSGVKFVFDAKQWEYGTCFVLESNFFGFICDTIDAIVKEFKKSNDRLIIVIDSVDGLRLEEDASKGLGDERVAGPPRIMKRFIIRMIYPFMKSGTVCIAISQVSSSINSDEVKLTSGGGGNALLHWSNYILEFQNRNWSDNILENGPNTKYDSEKNKIIGHVARLRIKKTDKENELTNVEYPIKHGATDGRSIWIEHEIIPFLRKWGMISVGGSWYELDATLLKDCEDKLKVKFQAKHQGFNNLLKYLESNPPLTKYLYDKIHFVEKK